MSENKAGSPATTPLTEAVQMDAETASMVRAMMPDVELSDAVERIVRAHRAQAVVCAALAPGDAT